MAEKADVFSVRYNEPNPETAKAVKDYLAEQHANNKIFPFGVEYDKINEELIWKISEMYESFMKAHFKPEDSMRAACYDALKANPVLVKKRKKA